MGEPAKQIDFQEAMKKLSAKESSAVTGVLQGKSRTQAMLDAGYSRSMAEKQQRRIFGRRKVQDALIAAMECQGINAENLAKIIDEGLRSDKLVLGKGNKKILVPDHGARYKYLITALDLRGDFAGREEDQTKETYEERIFRLRGLPIPK